MQNMNLSASEALRLGAMAVRPNPAFGLHFFAEAGTGHSPHACACGAMLYAAGVRENVGGPDVAARAIEMWPWLSGPMDTPAVAPVQLQSPAHGTIAGAIELLAYAGQSFTQIADWLEPIEAVQLVSPQPAARNPQPVS